MYLCVYMHIYMNVFIYIYILRGTVRDASGESDAAMGSIYLPSPMPPIFPDPLAVLNCLNHLRIILFQLSQIKIGTILVTLGKYRNYLHYFE